MYYLPWYTCTLNVCTLYMYTQTTVIFVFPKIMWILRTSTPQSTLPPCSNQMHCSNTPSLSTCGLHVRTCVCTWHTCASDLDAVDTHTHTHEALMELEQTHKQGDVAARAPGLGAGWAVLLHGYYAMRSTWVTWPYTVITVALSSSTQWWLIMRQWSKGGGGEGGKGEGGTVKNIIIVHANVVNFFLFLYDTKLAIK